MDVVNQFTQGLHSDNHPVDQPEGTYRNMQNKNLISQNGNHYSAEDQLGTVITFTLPDYTTTPGTLVKFTPIGFFSFVNELVVICTNDESPSGGIGMVGVVNIKPDGTSTTNSYGGGTTTFETIYYNTDLGLTKRNRLDGYALDETTKIKRVYWCDNLNNSRVINIASSSFAVVPSLKIVNGSQYMVVQGSITYNGIVYGPGQTATHIFTGTATTIYTGTGKVINYISTNSITIQPPATVGEINYKETTVDGNLYCGVKCYTSKLKNNTGKETTWGPVSKEIHVTSSITDNPHTFPNRAYQQYQGFGINQILANSGKSITITLSDLPFTDFQFVEVAAIEYDQKINVIRSITKIAEVAITSSTIDIKHSGQENLATFTTNDIVAIETIILSAKTMTTFKARGFQANLKERGEFTDPVTATLTYCTKRMPSDYTGGQGALDSDHTGPAVHVSTVGVSQIPRIAVDGLYKVIGAGGDTVQYPVGIGPIYNVGDTFVGIANKELFTTTGGAAVQGIIRIQKYSNGTGRYEDHDLRLEYWDYKGAINQFYLGGYFREETYRIGFLGFDKYRQPFFVRYLGDIKMPNQTYLQLTNVWAGINANTDNDAQISLNILGIQINNLVLTPDIVNRLDSFAIVRVKRDKTILTQGLMFPTAYKAGDTSKAVPATSYDPEVDFNAFTNSGLGKYGSFPGFVTLKSPELQFNNADFLTDLSLQQGDVLRPVASYGPLTPTTPTGSGPVNSAQPVYRIGDIGSNDFFTKWYMAHPYTSSGTGVNAPIVRCALSIEDSVISNFDGNGNDFENRRTFTCNYGSANHPLMPLNSINGGADTNYFATGGRSGLFLTTELDFNNASNANQKFWEEHKNRKLLVNWIRPKNPNSLYGGTSDEAKALNQYMFCGHIQKVDNQFKTDTLDTNPISPTFGKYVVNGIEVFGGDCLVQIYDTVNDVYDDLTSNPIGTHGFYSYGIYFPCECTVDVALRNGRNMGKDGLHNQANGVFIQKAAATQPEQFAVNSAYSTFDQADFLYPALPIGNISDGIFPARTRFSQVKTIGETIDNHRRYLPNDFRDVDTNHGEINNIKPTANLLFYWQNKGVGYFPVNQQQLLSNTIGGQVQLGIGGVLDRFDGVNLFYGNQHQWSLIETPDKFFWFDMRNKAMLYLDFSGQVIEYSTVKGMQSVLNNSFNSIEGVASPNIFDSDQPIMGRGISGWYDGKYQTVYMTFKTHNITGVTKYAFEDFTISVSRQKNFFLGTHSFVPGIAHNHNNNSISVITNVNTIQDTTAYVYGDLVSEAGIQYVCILSYTSGSPATVPSVDATHWVYDNGLISLVPKGATISDVNIHWRGDVCKFYGRVYDSFIDIVINAKGESVVFDNYEAYGNDENYTDVIASDSSGTAQDLNISAYDKNFKYWDGSWHASYPLKANGERLSDKYIIVRFNKQHHVINDFINSLNKVKRLLFLKSSIRLRK